MDTSPVPIETARRKLVPQPPSPPTEPITSKNFFLRGMAHIQANNSAVPATVGSPTHKAWATYFRDHLCWTPWFLTALETGQIREMTLPAQWPEWFDPDYRAAAS